MEAANAYVLYVLYISERKNANTELWLSTNVYVCRTIIKVHVLSRISKLVLVLKDALVID